MDVPENPPGACPVCERAYDSVSEHDAGVMVNLLDNDRYRRVCFEPKSEGRLRFYHHTHEQTSTGGERASADGEPSSRRSSDLVRDVE